MGWSYVVNDVELAHDEHEGEDGDHAPLDPPQDPPTSEEDDMFVILRRLAVPADSARWLLSGGKRIYLDNYTNVKALEDAGAATIALTDVQLGQLPQVRG